MSVSVGPIQLLRIAFRRAISGGDSEAKPRRARRAILHVSTKETLIKLSRAISVLNYPGSYEGASPPCSVIPYRRMR